MLLVCQPSPKGKGHMLKAKKSLTVVARTVRACAESVRVPSFSWDLLPKIAGLTQETV
jgi:hypothetical protein